jgi:hypothetical protein
LYIIEAVMHSEAFDAGVGILAAPIMLRPYREESDAPWVEIPLGFIGPSAVEARGLDALECVGAAGGDDIVRNMWTERDDRILRWLRRAQTSPERLAEPRAAMSRGLWRL